MKIGEKVLTVTGGRVPGEYTVVALLGEQRYTDDCHNLAVARCIDGHHEIIHEDNATRWEIGDEGDAENNRDTFAVLAGAKLEPDVDEEKLDALAKAGAWRVLHHLGEIRAIDANLADWIAERANEAFRKAGGKFAITVTNGDRVFSNREFVASDEAEALAAFRDEEKKGGSVYLYRVDENGKSALIKSSKEPDYN